MFDRSHARFGEELLGVVVNQLTVDEAVDAVTDDLFALALHLLSLRLFDFRHLGHGIDAHARSVNFNFIGIHRRVRDQNLSVFDSLRLTDAKALVQDEAFVKE